MSKPKNMTPEQESEWRHRRNAAERARIAANPESRAKADAARARYRAKPDVQILMRESKRERERLKMAARGELRKVGRKPGSIPGNKLPDTLPGVIGMAFGNIQVTSDHVIRKSGRAYLSTLCTSCHKPDMKNLHTLRRGIAGCRSCGLRQRYLNKQFEAFLASLEQEIACTDVEPC